jgi:hypothetical protein
MDAGTNNTGASWYEVGFNTNVNALTTGIPAAGSTFTHATFPDHQYAMAPSYAAPNALLINPGQVTNGTITVTAPAAYGNLSFLASGGNGGCTIDYTIHHADATTETGTLTVGDWFSGANPAWTANGRVSVTAHTFDNVNNNNPRLYGYDVALANTASAVTSIDVTFASGTGRAGILAVSGAPVAGGNWAPIAVSGYNYDMVIEAGAPQAGPLTAATSASMDGGTNNTGNTWFERGYDPFNPNAGLPVAGSTISSAALPDHHYLLAASYAANNAIYADSNLPIANLTLAAPMRYSALSFLSATANGSVTNECVMQYADGTSETNMFVSRDWFNNTPVAFAANGRVNLNNKTFNNINAGNPRLYEAQFALGNTASAVTNVVLKWIGGSVNSRVVVLAVSATAGAVAPIINSHPASMGAYEGSNVMFLASVAGTLPLVYQWQRGTNGMFVDLANVNRVSGATTTNLSISNVTLGDAAEYRLVAKNASGYSTSSVAVLTVLSALPDVTAPGDAITVFGGTTPGNETVDHAIDNLMQKYLNYGSGPNAQLPPFVGPVGLVVTPAAGLTRVTGLRFYTANDATERDPTNYLLEGSTNDGASYTLISSNALSLPDGRNGSGGLSPTNQFLQQVLFSNAMAYTSYRLTFSNVKNATLANSMQIGEVEFLGVLEPQGPVLTIVHDADGTVTVSSSMVANLQSTTELKGPATIWEEYGPIAPGSAGSQAFSLSPGEIRFFRAVLPQGSPEP